MVPCEKVSAQGGTMLKGTAITLRPVREADLDQLYAFHIDIDNRGAFFPRVDGLNRTIRCDSGFLSLVWVSFAVFAIFRGFRVPKPFAPVPSITRCNHPISRSKWFHGPNPRSPFRRAIRLSAFPIR